MQKQEKGPVTVTYVSFFNFLWTSDVVGTILFENGTKWDCTYIYIYHEKENFLN